MKFNIKAIIGLLLITETFSQVNAMDELYIEHKVSLAGYSDMTQEEKAELNKKCQLDNYCVFIASRYFDSIDDFINLEKCCSRFRGNMTKFFYNPISLTGTTRPFFDHLRTLYLYPEEDDEYALHLYIEGTFLNDDNIQFIECYRLQCLDDIYKDLHYQTFNKPITYKSIKIPCALPEFRSCLETIENQNEGTDTAKQPQLRFNDDGVFYNFSMPKLSCKEELLTKYIVDKEHIDEWLKDKKLALSKNVKVIDGIPFEIMEMTKTLVIPRNSSKINIKNLHLYKNVEKVRIEESYEPVELCDEIFFCSKALKKIEMRNVAKIFEYEDNVRTKNCNGFIKPSEKSKFGFSKYTHPEVYDIDTNITYKYTADTNQKDRVDENDKVIVKYYTVDKFGTYLIN